MAITKNVGRQDILVARVEFGYADLTSGSFEAAAELPPNAEVVGGELVIDTVFDSGTSDTLTVGDSSSGGRYASGIDGQSAARTALTPTGYRYTGRDNVGITWTGAGTAPSQGAGHLNVQYIIKDRAVETE